MKALVLGDRGPEFRSDLARPERRGEALVRVRLAGVCATDLELVKGYMGFRGVLGHEWVGSVEGCADPGLAGRRVVGDINCPCRACPECSAGRPTHCPNRTVLGILGRDGAFAEFLTLPEANLHPIPDSVADDAAVFVEPLAAACEILEQVHVRPSDRIAVLGLGRLGWLSAAVLAATGAEVSGVVRTPRPHPAPPPGVKSIDLGLAAALPRFDVVVDATGAAAGLEAATRLVRPRGVIVLKTTIHGATPLAPTPWVIDETTVVGSRCGPFEPALRLLASGRVDPRPLIAGRYRLEAGIDALRRAAEPAVLKVLIEP